MTNTAQAAVDIQIEAITVTALDAGLVKFITDSDLSKRLIAEALPNQPVKQALARYMLRLLAPMVAAKARKGGGWLADRALGRLGSLIRRIPGVDELLKAIHAKLQSLKSVDEAEEQFRQIVQGRRPVHDHDDAAALTLDRQADLRLLSDVAGIGDHIAAMRAEMADWINPQPALTIDFRDPAYDAGRFHYGAQRVPFVGRATELAYLTAFLYLDRPFCWWMVTGPAGMGKSRLALELILREANVWRAGFLPRGGAHDWQRWQPDRPTLIVVDYALERPDSLRTMIAALRRRQDLELPVRVLVLERGVDDAWADKLFGAGGDGHAVTEALAKAPLELRPPSTEDQVALFMAACAAVGLAEQPAAQLESYIIQLLQLDPRLTPLIVVLFVDAVARHGDGRQWDRAALMNDVLLREYDRWHALGADSGHIALLGLATLCRTLSLADLAGADVEDAPVPQPVQVDETLLAAMTGTAPASAMAPLEPDLLGELFVLDLLERHLPNRIARQRLLDLAWSCRPLETMAGIFRMIRDYPNHSGIVHFAYKPRLPSGGRFAVWAEAAAVLVRAYCDAGLKAPAWAMFEELSRLAEAQYDQPGIRYGMAHGAYSLIVAQVQAGDVATARTLFERQRILAADHPGEPELHRLHVRSTVGLVIAYGLAGDTATARTLVDDLTAQVRTLPWPTDDPAAFSDAESWYRCLTELGHLLSVDDKAAERQLYESVTHDPHLAQIAAHFAQREAAERGIPIPPP